jgi:hypothetical protein
MASVILRATLSRIPRPRLITRLKRTEIIWFPSRNLTGKT